MTHKDLTICQELPIYGKNICTIGNWGHQNVGDEIILIGLMKLLQNNSQLFVSGGDLPFLKRFHRYFFSDKELESVEYIQEIPHGVRSGLRFLISSGFSAFWTYLRCDVFIIGGGELFTEETPGSYLYWFWSLIPFWIRKLFVRNTKLYIMGGMQEPSAWYNKVMLRLIVGKAQVCYMRDSESVEVANKNHARSAKWFIDTSYFAVNDARNLETLTPRNLVTGKHIIINSNPLSKERTKQLGDTVRQYYDKGYKIYYLPAFFTSNPEQDDMSVFQQLQSDYQYILLLDRRKWSDFINVFLSAEKVFCSRLHVFLLAAFLKLDVCPYPYQKKIKKNEAILKRCGILT